MPSECRYFGNVVMDGGKAHDPVSAPAHYAGDGKTTCMEAMKSMMGAADVGPAEAYWWGCALKYVWRWPHKNGAEDIRKAIRCLEILLEEVGDAV